MSLYLGRLVVDRAVLPAVFCLALASTAGCRKRSTPPATTDRSPAFPSPTSFDGGRAREEVAALIGLGPRVSGTAGAEHAANHLTARLDALGVAVNVDSFRDRTPEGERTFRNVIGVLPASRHDAGIVVLVSHYDTKAGIGESFVGANDSGSSSGVLLALAAALAPRPERPLEIRLAFVDGEESLRRYGPTDGLHGSRRLAKRLVEAGEAHRVRAVIVLDMIGDRDLTVTIPPDSTPRLTQLVMDAARREGIRFRFALSRNRILDDHVPFLDAGMPAIDLIDFEYGSEPGLNDYWHTTSDTLDKLSAESLGMVGRVVLRSLDALAQD